MTRTPRGLLVFLLLVSGSALAGKPHEPPKPDPEPDPVPAAVAGAAAGAAAIAGSQSGAAAHASGRQNVETEVGVDARGGTANARTGDSTSRVAIEQSIGGPMIGGDELALQVEGDALTVEGDTYHYEAARFPAETAYASQASECVLTYGAQGSKGGITLSRVPKICRHAMASGLWVGMAQLAAKACTGDECGAAVDHAMDMALRHLEALSGSLGIGDE